MEFFPISACQTLVGGLWLSDCYISCDGHDSLKWLGQTLAFSSLLPTYEYKPRNGGEESLQMSKTWDEKTISKSKPIFALL